MLLDLESLRCFAAAADLLNFRAAAQQVGLSPAALGQRIRQMEEQLGTSLFNRTTRRVVLTPAGLALLPVAQQTLESAAECVLAVRGETGHAPISLVIGTRHELGLSWLVPMLPTLQTAHPGLTCHTYFGSGEDLEVRLRSRQIDCAITSKKPADPLIDAIRLHTEEYTFVGSPEVLAANPIESVDDLSRHTLVDTTKNTPLFSYFRDQLKDALHLEFFGIRYMGTIEAIRLVISQGSGIGVLPTYMIRSDLKSGQLVPILPDYPLATDWFRLILRKDDPRRAFFEAIAITMRAAPLR
jgi:DNA-binding transcriptional LysR family regulator